MFDRDKEWKCDVERFARWRRFYDNIATDRGKSRALQIMRELQEKWDHKLGDMPDDQRNTLAKRQFETDNRQ